MQSDGPSAEIVRPEGGGPLVLACEHAAWHIPAEYGDLGLSGPALRSHAAWDIGARDVALALSSLFDAPLVAGVDAVQGPGAGAAELQLLMDAAGRYASLFDTVEAKPTGLPVLPVLFNQAKAPETEQRRLLTAGLLDLVERATQHLPTLIDEAEVDDVLEEVARSDYRKHLRM